MTSCFILVLLSVYVLYLVGVGVHRVWWHPLSKFPGPKLWALSRLPWLWHMVRGDLWRALTRLHDEYGDTVRIAPSEITTLSIAAWQDIYINRPLLPKEPYSQTPPLNGAHSLFTAENETHLRIRGILANAFSNRALREQATIIEHYTGRLITRIERELGKASSPTLDITRFYGYAVFDTITDLSYGESTKCLETEGYHPYIYRFFLHAQYSTIRNSLRWYSPLDKVLDFFLLRMTRSIRARNWADASKKLDRRLSRGDMTGIRTDLVTPVVGRIVEEEKILERGITKREVLCHALAVVIADSQLTTAALSSYTYLLLKHRRVWEEAAREIRGTFENEEEITVLSTQRLVYLEAVINESLRIHHPSPISLPRVVPAGQGPVICGDLVPANSIVGISLQNIQLWSKYWRNPLEFRPERFLPPTDPRYNPMFEYDVKAAFMPFSTGRRNCIGAK